MSKNTTHELDFSDSSVITDDLANELRTDFLDYAMSVIVARALPDVRDGLKPVHRRILYAMYESGIRPDRPHKKSAWTVGEVIGKYHPHGDSAVYDTMVRLAQDFSMRVPLVDGHGNFGSVDGDSAAAMRYTEARLQKAAMELLRDIDKDTVDYQPNYDESLQEPSVLPSRFPNLLVNGSSGIAVGMATNIPPHNLGESIDAVKLYPENPDVTVDELMKVLPGPDFPTAAIIMGRDGIKEAYETGKGSITIRSRAIQEHTTSGRDRIVITEIPYMVNKANMISKIADLVRDKKITEISDLRDESDRNGMRIVIELKKDAIPEVVLNKLYKHTQLQTSFGINMIALVDGTPRQLSLRDILKDYCDYQREVIIRRTKFDLKKALEREHILEGRVIALDNIDEVIEIIRGSRTDEVARMALMERFGLTEIQARDILEMRLKRLTGLERENLEAELAEVKQRIAYYRQVLEDDALVRKIIIEEMAEIKDKYSNPRRTEISDSSAAALEVEDLIAEEDMVVTITNTGYVKRLPVATYRQQKRGGKGLSGINLKENDYVDEMFIASTHDFVLFFTNLGKVYRLKVHELPVGSRQAKGHAIINLLPFAEGEKIAATISTKSFSKDECLIFATRDGLVKKTTMDLYDRSRRDGIIAIKLRGGDELIEVRRVKKGEKIMMVSSNGKAIKWDESEARAMGRDTTGVKGMTVPAGYRVLGMEIAREGSDLMVITERGYGKRTSVDDYPEQHRGGQGVNTITMTEKKGRLTGMKIVIDSEELLISTEEGVLIRTKAKGISRLGRATQGVKIMDVADSDRVTAVARYNEEEAEENRVQKKGENNQLTLEVDVEDENA